MSRTRKVMDICDNGCHLEVIKIVDPKDYNPYRIKKVVGGNHHYQIAAYGVWMAVIYFLRDFYMEGMDTKTTAEIKEWWKRGFGK